ncbi:MAG: universal stress protein [Actinomycetota bacterium]
MYEHIVAGTDLSDTARIATARAALLASSLDAKLTLLCAGPDPGEPLRALGEEFGADAISVHGHPAEVLVAEVESLGADLLVVGSVGMSGARRFMLGNVPNKVSHHVGKDLLIVKTDRGPRSSSQYRKILAGTDGSDTAMRAVDAACALASKLSALPVVACVYEPPSEAELNAMRAGEGDALSQWSASRDVRDTPDEFRWRIAGASQAEDVLDRALVRAERQGVQAETRAIRGRAAEALLEVADSEEFDLMVVGSVGMTGTRRFTLGNVPHRISHHAPVDVLIVHTA